MQAGNRTSVKRNCSTNLPIICREGDVLNSNPDAVVILVSKTAGVNPMYCNTFIANGHSYKRASLASLVSAYIRQSPLGIRCMPCSVSRGTIEPRMPYNSTLVSHWSFLGFSLPKISDSMMKTGLAVEFGAAIRPKILDRWPPFCFEFSQRIDW